MDPSGFEPEASPMPRERSITQTKVFRADLRAHVIFTFKKIYKFSQYVLLNGKARKTTMSCMQQ